MRTRIELNEALCEILGSRHVYFQPPNSTKMQYPAIVYSRDNIETRHANNGLYLQSPRFTVTVIDKDPESEIVDKVLALPKCRFDRHFTADNLNHDVFTIYL